MFSDVYIAETAHPDIRATLGSFPGFVISIGLSLIFIFGYFCHWRTIAYLAALVPIIEIMLLIFLPESPYWLMEHDTDESAYIALQYFRNPNDDISEEINEIHQRKLEKLETQGTTWQSTLEILGSKAFLKPFSCIGIIWSLNMLSGFPALTNYLISIMEESGSDLDPKLGPATIGILGLAVACKTKISLHSVVFQLFYGHIFSPNLWSNYDNSVLTSLSHFEM